MMETLLGTLFMAIGIALWLAVVRRTGDVLHPLGLMLLFWLVTFGYGHWDVAVTYDEPYYALPFGAVTYVVVLGSALVFALGYLIMDPGLPHVESEALAARLRSCVRLAPLQAFTLVVFAAASATTLLFIRTVGEIPLFSPRVDELRQVWKQPLLGYVYDLHYVVALFGTILVDRVRGMRERAFWGTLVLASLAQLSLGAVRLSPLTGVVWAAVYIFYRRAGRVKLRHLAALGLVVLGISTVIEYYRRTPLRLNPELANPRLDLGVAATLWGHTGASFKNLQLSLRRDVPFLGMGATSYDVAKTLDPALRARDAEISNRYGVHNTTTYLLPLYMDFGLFGLTLMPGLYGAATAFVHRRFRDRTNLFWLVVHIEFLIAVVLAFRTHRFFGNTLLFFGAVAFAASVVAGADSTHAVDAEREDELEGAAAA